MSNESEDQQEKLAVDEVVFLYSIFTGLPDRVMQGYAFVGSDYIFGQAGAVKYEAASGDWVPPGEDGSYFTVLRDGSHHIVGVDHAGHKKLFLYQSGSVWAISNSLLVLAEHLRSHGARLTVNHAQIGGLQVRAMIASQVNCFDTIFNEVRLVPSTYVLHIDGANVQAVCRSRPRWISYDEALAQYLSIWVSRMTTLGNNASLRKTSDLTGGVDSRSILGLVHRALPSSLPNHGFSFFSGHGERWRNDLAIAAQITSLFGLPLNTGGAETGRPLRSSQRYAVWAALNLGVYLPIYFPRSTPMPEKIHFHGGGGENHRPFYPYMDPADFIRKLRGPVATELLTEWKEAVTATIEDLQKDDPHIHPLILHYRQFRHRMHSGRTPQYIVAFAPLSSKYLDPASLAAPDRVQMGQINFDLIESLVPGLIDFPYDDPGKAPTRSHLANLSVVPINHSSNGRAYYDEQRSPDEPLRPGPAPLAMLRDHLREAATSPVQRVLGGEAIKSAKSTVLKAIENNGFGHASDAKDITRVLTVSFALQYGA